MFQTMTPIKMTQQSESASQSRHKPLRQFIVSACSAPFNPLNAQTNADPSANTKAGGTSAPPLITQMDGIPGNDSHANIATPPIHSTDRTSHSRNSPRATRNAILKPYFSEVASS